MATQNPISTPPRNLFTAGLFNKIVSPIERFMHLETSSGIVLLIVTVVALLWANSPWSQAYEHMVHTEISLRLGHWHLTKSLHHWINDGLMAIFFFVVGMEIKRELVIGELSTSKKAALPMFAALGGMVVPATIYAFFNSGSETIRGWGIPMATDIAFALGILALMSRRVPFAVKIFLLALAIVDDLGAVLVIALFYTDQISGQALLFATGTIGLLYLLHISGIRKQLVYIVLGIFVWFFVLKSGIHATIAGVILGVLVPTRSFYMKKSVPHKMKELVDSIDLEVEEVAAENQKALTQAAHKQIHELHQLVSGVESPLDRAMHMLHPWVSFFIMPTFALVNAGVSFEHVSINELLSHPVSLGVILGLVVGKPVGITLFSWIACRMKLASLPEGVGWNHILATGFLGGIGFTMALFISSLALTDPAFHLLSKLGILLASLLSGLIGSLLLIFFFHEKQAPQ